MSASAGPKSAASADPSIAGPVIMLDRAMRSAIAAAFGPQFADVDPQIKPSQNPQFGDFQANCAMSLAKQLSLLDGKPGPGSKPREVAMKIVAAAPPELLALVE